jgi:hypothetical protein
LFGHISYAWLDQSDKCWMPLLGIGGEVEFGSASAGSASECCRAIRALSQWEVWIKGGIAFN